MKKKISPKSLLLLLAVLLSPLTCCGGTYILNSLPASFPLNIFKTEFRVENHTEETLYITPITTTTGGPLVIKQTSSIRQRDFPISPGRSIVLTYDAADRPLSGIAVCRSSDDCRLFVTDYSNEYALDTYEDLPPLEQTWLLAVQASPKWGMDIIIFPLLGLVPIIMFASWVNLSVKDRKSKGTKSANDIHDNESKPVS